MTDDATAVEPRSPGGSGRGRMALLVPWAIALVAVIVAAFSTIEWRSAAEADASRQDALEVAGTFVDALTTWDATGGLDATRERIESLGTGQLLEELETFFSGPDIPQLVALQARSEGTIDSIAVQVDGETAVAFAEAQMQVSDTSDAPPSTIRQQIRLELLREDGTWRVARFETAVYDDAVAVLGDASGDGEEGGGS
ncbi:MAG: nuclear transport factor 2 family protein [Actinobacteria bacterium]|nr:nuclear transport factor 2 family protein [Actinomycetota bacterium]